MKHLLHLAGASILAAGVIFAQSAAPTTQQTPADGAGQHSWAKGRAHSRAGMAQHMAKVLNFTPDQKANAKQVMADARQQAQPLRQQLKQNREALANAVKAGDNAQIDQLTSAQAPVIAQLTAIRAKAFEKIYATLTPEQKAKADSMRQSFASRRHMRHPHNGAAQSNS